MGYMNRFVGNRTSNNDGVAAIGGSAVSVRRYVAWILALVLILSVLALVGPVPGAQAAPDTTPPELVEFSFVPTSVDTSTGDQTIMFIARITDDISGMGGEGWSGGASSVTFASPSGNQMTYATFSGFQRISGDGLDGVYTYSATIPQYSEPGTWTAEGFYLEDGVGNWQWLETSDLVSKGFPTTFTQTGAGDTTPPQLVEFSFTPTSIDTSTGDRTITFTARITDDIAGTGGGSSGVSSVLFVSPSDTQQVWAVFEDDGRVSGNATDGVYAYTATIPQYAEQGTWTVDGFSVVDQVGNGQWLVATDLVAMGFPTTFTQTGAGDTTPPELVEFSFTPTSIDTSTGDRTITFTARITDDVSGMGGEGWSSGGSSVTFASPSGDQFVGLGFSAFDRTSGGPLDGVYTYTATVPQYSEQGTWTVDGFWLSDDVGNYQRLEAIDLVAKGFPTTFDVDEGGGGTPPPGTPPTSMGQDVGLVDPSQGQWHLRNSVGAVTSFYFGNPGDYPIMGDWDCDGIDTPGMYRQSDGYVYLRNSNSQGIADIRFFFGNPGDVPLAGDFNGDGCDTVSIYRPSQGQFFIINELGANEGGLGAAETDYFFGNPGDKPFVGDFNGNGIDTVGLHRESTGLVYFRQTHTQGIADAQFIFGDPGDRLVAGDWNSNGVDSPALFRPGSTTYYFRYSNTQGNADAQFVFGSPSWLPVAGMFGLG